MNGEEIRIIDGHDSSSYFWIQPVRVIDYSDTNDSILNILADMKDTIEALSSGRENEFTVKLREKKGSETYKLLYAKNLTQEQIDEYNANIPTEDDTPIDLIIDFYRRFISRMEFMLEIGKENGYDLISFMGP